MANRYFTQFRFSLEKMVVDLFGSVTFGASGAPTLSAINSKGIKSITRVSAGLYDIVLGVGSAQDVYPALLVVDHKFLNATAPAAPLMYIVSESVATPTTGKVRIQFTAVDGTTATDPASGEVVKLHLALKNSTAQ